MNSENKEDINSYEKGVLLADEIISVLRTKSGTSDLSDFPQIAEWIEENPYAQELIDKLSNEALMARMSEQYSSRNAAKQVQRFYDSIEKRTLKRRILRISVSVCGVAAMISMFVFFVFKHDNRIVIPQSESFAIKQEITQPTLILKSGERISIDDKNYAEQIVSISQSINTAQYNKLIVPPKCKFRLALEDGSIVYLNADSELSYPIHFSEDNRRIFLNRGEAYFEIAKSKNPLEINIDNAVIKVYGTKFNVNYYSRNIIQTVLFEGSLGLALNNINETIIHPGELIIVNNISGDKEIRAVNTRKYLTWVNGFVCCDEDPLQHMLEQISRWYNVRFIVEESVNTQLLVNAYFNIERPLDEILKSIEDITHVKFIKMEGGEYMVK